MRVLEVRGRKTGHWYQRPVAVAAIDGQRYIISLWGESQWARTCVPAPGRSCGSEVGWSPLTGASWRTGRTRSPSCSPSHVSTRSSHGPFKVDPKQVTLEQAREGPPSIPPFRIDAAAADRLQSSGTQG
jgi:hypothetical protein